LAFESLENYAPSSKIGKNFSKLAQKDTKMGENFVSALDEGSYFC